MKLSVCCITYRHEKFIAEALDGILMQQTDFDFEIVVGEDGSPDGTANVIREYEKKHPAKFHVLYHDKNVGMMPNFIQTLSACKGEYIALCEGDDFWTDPLKVQKQVDLLDANPDAVCCYSNASLLNMMPDKRSGLYLKKKFPPKHDIQYMLNGGITPPTCTCIIKKSALPDPLPEWFSKIFHGDVAMHCLIGLKGNFLYLDQATACYRMHGESAINSVTNHISRLKNFLLMFEQLNEFMGKKYTPVFNVAKAYQLENLAYDYLKQGNYKKFIDSITMSLWLKPRRSFKALRDSFYRFREALG